jgi:hypothetical protein
VLSLVLVGASVWCAGLVKQAHSEQQQWVDPPAQSKPVAAPDTPEKPQSESEQLADVGRTKSSEITPAG